MTDNSREHNLEIGLFVLAFGLALVLRLLRLGELPLTDTEAGWALQAFEFTKGLRPVIASQPGYVGLTALIFFIFQSSNFAARLVPALFGAALSLAPFYFRDRLGRTPAIVMAFLLAFDPGFLALSRLAGSPVLSVAALLFAWAAWRKASWRAAGIWAGIALLGGASFWAGVLGLGLGFGLLRGYFARHERVISLPAFDRAGLLSLGAFAVGTYVLLGSLFLLMPGGLSAGLAALPVYFGGWVDFNDVPALRLLTSLAFYEPLAVILAIISLVRGVLRRDELVISLAVWLLVALLLALAYPLRQVGDLAWMLIPLLALAALEFSNHLVPIAEGRWETLGMTIFTASILIFAFINYSAIALVPMDAAALQLRWWVLLGSLALLTLSILMVAFGWSAPIAAQGSMWGALAVLVVYSLSTAMAAGGLRTYRSVEMWPEGPATGQAKILISQMNDLSRWKAGVNNSLDITIAGVASPALRWLLRDWPLTISDNFKLAGNPSIVISSDQFPSANIETAYRGESFNWRTYPGWNQGLMTDWLKWSILHEFPQGVEKLILWVRTDIFIDSQNIR